MSYNATDTTHIGHRTSRQRREEKELERAFREVLKTHEGRLVFASLIKQAGVHQSVYDPNPVEMAFRSGMQNFGHTLQAQLIAASESGFELMAREARARNKAEAAVDQAVVHEDTDDARDTELYPD